MLRRTYFIGKDIVFIPLTNGLWTFVSRSSYDQIDELKRPWYANRTGRNGDWYAYRTINRKNVGMHKLIVTRPEGSFVDHKNSNTLDNRIENIRVCDSFQNARNIRKHRDASHSRFKGVTMDLRRGTWRANIYVNSKQTHLGSFKNEEDAALAYNEAAIKFFGEFAHLNEIT